MKYNQEEYPNNVLSIQSSLVEAKATIEKYHLNNIIIVDDNQFLGIITAAELYNADDASFLGDLRHLLRPVYLREDYTLFDWLRLTSAYDMINLPIVDEEDMSFMKMVNYQDILKKFDNTGLNLEGSTVLVLKKSSKAFSYSEVFQVAEANAAKIFGSYIDSSNEDETKIVLNIYHLGLNELLQSYRRYDYEVISFHEEDLHHETLKANSEYFSKYLTV